MRTAFAFVGFLAATRVYAQAGFPPPPPIVSPAAGVIDMHVHSHPDSLVISSDLGQSQNMTHPDGIEAAIAALRKENISDADIDLMMRKNPARLLGLPN